MAEVAAPWLCCAGGSGETPRGAPPARGQRLLPGIEPPWGLPGWELAAPTPHSARGQEPAQFFLWPLLFLWLPGSTRGPWLSPPAPSSTTKEAEVPPVQLRCVLPRVPQPSSGGSVPAPRAVLQGKLGFPSKGCNPGRAGGGQGRWLSLGWWLGATKAGRAAIPGQDRLPSRGAVTPLSPLSLCGAWLWMGMVWGVQPFSLQPQELLYGWGEAGPAAPPCPACHSLRSLDSMIVRLCAPSLTRRCWSRRGFCPL